MTGFLGQVPALQPLYCPTSSSFLQVWPEAFQFLPHFLYTWGKIMNSQLKAFKTMYTVCPLSQLSVWELTHIKSSQKNPYSEKFLDALTRKTFCCNNQLKIILALLLSICSLSIPGVTPQARDNAEGSPSTASPDKYPCAMGHSPKPAAANQVRQQGRKETFFFYQDLLPSAETQLAAQSQISKGIFLPSCKQLLDEFNTVQQGIAKKEDHTWIDPILFQGVLLKSQTTKLDSTDKSFPLCLHQACQEIRTKKASCLTGVSSTLEITAFT